MPVSERSNVAMSLVGLFDSQVSGGKRYDLATEGRRRAHATYHASHGTDVETALTFAMDLTPLIENPALPLTGYILGFIDRLVLGAADSRAGLLVPRLCRVGLRSFFRLLGAACPARDILRLW